MQTTYRLKAEQIGSTFVESVKSQFADKEVEITVRSVDDLVAGSTAGQKKLLKMVADNRENAPVIPSGYDLRDLIDESQYPAD